MWDFFCRLRRFDRSRSCSHPLRDFVDVDFDLPFCTGWLRSALLHCGEGRRAGLGVLRLACSLGSVLRFSKTFF